MTDKTDDEEFEYGAEDELDDADFGFEIAHPNLSISTNSPALRNMNIMFDNEPKFQLTNSKVQSKYIPYELFKDLSSPSTSEKFLKNRVSLSFRGIFNYDVESLKIHVADEITKHVEPFDHSWTMYVGNERGKSDFRVDLMFESETDIKKVEEFLVLEKLSKE